MDVYEFAEQQLRLEVPKQDYLQGLDSMVEELLKKA